jgi:hypothetical protein
MNAWDGSGGYSSTNESVDCAGCGEVKYGKISKGDRYPVVGVFVEHPDFSTKVALVTEIGRFLESDYKKAANITVNKAVKDDFFATAGNLMYYPFVFDILTTKKDKALPGVKVIVEDDKGVLREGVLWGGDADSLSVKSGDKVRLNCRKSFPYEKTKKVCEIQSPGHSVLVVVDENGIPQETILKLIHLGLPV